MNYVSYSEVTITQTTHKLNTSKTRKRSSPSGSFITVMLF